MVECVHFADFYITAAAYNYDYHFYFTSFTYLSFPSDACSESVLHLFFIVLVAVVSVYHPLFIILANIGCLMSLDKFLIIIFHVEGYLRRLLWQFTKTGVKHVPFNGFSVAHMLRD